MFGRDGGSGDRENGRTKAYHPPKCLLVVRSTDLPITGSPDQPITRSPDLLHGFVHGHNVLRGNIGQDIVNLLEDEAATGAEDLYLFFDVPAHFKEQVQILSPGGGFVFQQVHNILANVPPQNIVAMYEAVQEIGRSIDRVIC